MFFTLNSTFVFFRVLRVHFFKSVASGFLLVFVFLGYLYSDNNYADNIIAEKSLVTPDDVFSYVISVRSQDTSNLPVVSGQSFTELMRRKDERLWCDEGSIVLAVLISRLGYETRLVDLLDTDGVSKHTILQVLVGNSWIGYDFSGRKYGVNPLESVGYSAAIRLRSFPNLFHKVLLANAGIRYSFQLIRPYFYLVKSYIE